MAQQTYKRDSHALRVRIPGIRGRRPERGECLVALLHVWRGGGTRYIRRVLAVGGSSRAGTGRGILPEAHGNLLGSGDVAVYSRRLHHGGRRNDPGKRLLGGYRRLQRVVPPLGALGGTSWIRVYYFEYRDQDLVRRGKHIHVLTRQHAVGCFPGIPVGHEEHALGEYRPEQAVSAYSSPAEGGRDAG